MKLTRRKLAARWYRPPLLSAQQTPARQVRDDDLKAARDRLKANAAALGRVPLPMATEPAFQFKA